MHASSFEKFRAFRNAYLTGSERILEVGCGFRLRGHKLRELFAPPFDYVGLDIEPGQNVDLVPSDSYQWTELATESVDVVLSNQTFEHVPLFWVTTAEIARVLRPGGLTCVVAPSDGKVHGHPFDCWRFYPDSWSALCGYVGLELLETYREQRSWRFFVPGVAWGDAMMVARKPTLSDEVERKTFYDRLDAIVATRTAAVSPRALAGPAVTLYEQVHAADTAELVRHPLNTRRIVPPLSRWPGAKQVRRTMTRRNTQRALRRGEAALPWPPVTP